MGLTRWESISVYGWRTGNGFSMHERYLVFVWYGQEKDSLKVLWRLQSNIRSRGVC